MLTCNRGVGMGRPLSMLFLLVMLQAVHVFCDRIDRGKDTTSEEQNKTKAELHGQGTGVTPVRNAAVTAKEEWSRRPPGMAVEKDDKRLSHDTGNTTTNTTLFYPPAQHHSDSSNAPETPKPAALTDQRLKKLKDWSDKSSMTSDGRDTGGERGRSGNPFDKSSMTSDGRDTGGERGRSGNPFDKSSMTSDGRDTRGERGRSGNPFDKSSVKSDGRDTGEKTWSDNPSGKSSMTLDGRDTGQEKSWPGSLSAKSSMTSDGRDTGEERSWPGNPSDKSSMTSDGRDTGEDKSRSGNPSDKSSMTSDGRDTREDKSRSGNPSDKSSMTSDGRDTGEKRSWSYNTSQKALTTSRPELEATRVATKKQLWQDVARNSTTTAWREEDVRKRMERLKTMNHNERMERLKTMNHNERTERLKTMNRNERTERLKTMNHNERTERLKTMNYNERIKRLKTMNHNQRTERLKTMNHNERTERLKTMHLNVSSARRDDKAEGRGLTNRSWEQSDDHAQRRMRQATYGDAELTRYYQKWSCPCQCCLPVRTRSNLAQVAYKKPSYMSSRWFDCVVPCGGNNGNDNHTIVFMPSSKPNGVNTGDQDVRAWWWVDLSDMYTVTSYTMTHRNEYWQVGHYSLYFSHWYNNVVTIDGVECHYYGTNATFLQGIDASVRQVQSCTSVIRSRHVMVQKKDIRRKPYPWNIISFTELAIYACLPGYYWKQTANLCVPCTPPCKYICDNYAGCNTIYNYNVVSKKTNVEMSPLDYGVRASTTDGRVVSSLTSNYRECVSSTSTSTWKYWRVDLGLNHYIFKFFVTPTISFNRLRMTNMHFLVMRQRASLVSKVKAGPTEICRIFTGSFYGSRQPFPCVKPPLMGSLVVIQAPPIFSFSFCEVEVMGYSVNEIGPGGTGCGELETSFCEEGFVCDNKICKIPIGGNCARSNLRTFCHSRATCDGGICKLKLHENCSATTERDQCKIDTECDPTVNYQCRIVPGGPCQTANGCSRSARYTCDALSQCRVKPGQTCSRNSECVSGASCSSSSCQCNTIISQPSGNFCVPGDGYAGSICGNSNSTTPCTAHAMCVNNICQCEDGYEVFPVTLTCERFKGANSDCTSVPCDSGLLCEGNKCKLDVHDRCTETTDCRGNAFCDENIDSCRLRPGVQCENSSFCGTTTSCYKGTCRLVLGEGCTPSDDKCSISTKCSTNVHNTAPLCLLEQGQGCFRDNKTMCVDGTVCDKDSICRIPRGAQCSSINAEYCGLGTQCGGGSCRLLQGSKCQTNGIKCSPGLVCDSLGQCSVPVNGNCSETPEGCLAGARCNPTDHTCQCQTDDCNPGSGMIGSNCTVTVKDPEGKESCNDPFAICDRDLGVCQCNDEYEHIRANFSCGQGVGSSCNSSRPCTAGLMCDYGDICVVAAGGTCEGRKSLYCGRDAFCDKDKFCRWRSGTDCRSRKDMCQLGLRCDSSGVCKVPLNKECHYLEQCEVAASCNETTSRCTCIEGIARPTTLGDSCEPNPGRVGGDCSPKCLDPNSVCNNQKCECSPGYTVNSKDFTCSTGLGESCEKDEECGPGASCDNENKCSLLLGQSCRGKLKEHCGPLDVCDKNDECKTKRQGKCNRDDFLPCETGTFCDWLGTCSLGVGSTCSSTSLCPAGAICVETLCQCDEVKAVAYDIYCKPAEGRVGADCDQVATPCKMPGAECVDGICQCADGVETTFDFECEGHSLSILPATSKVTKVEMLVGLVVSALALLSCLAFVIVGRRRNRKDKQKEVFAERRRSIANMNFLVAGVDGSNPASESEASSGTQDEADSTQQSDSSSGTPDQTDNDSTAVSAIPGETPSEFQIKILVGETAGE